MAAKKAVATQDFVAITEDGYRVVQVGEELEASDEVVKANPELFSGLAEQAAPAPAKRKR